MAGGGDLHPHLPLVVPEKLEPHGDSVEREGADVKSASHDVRIVRGTLAYTVYRRTTLRGVMSMHHQAADDPGLLVVSGFSPRGVAEILVHPDPRASFHMGVQYHPESDSNGASGLIFPHFANAVKLGGRLRSRSAA